jgi:hypothetical protein
MKKALLLILILVIVGCDGQEREYKMVEHPAKETGFYSKLKKAGDIDEGGDEPQGLGAIAYEKDEHDFGDITEGQVVSYPFKFKNIGEGPLLITNVTSKCGCTIPEWPKTPVMPGENGEILVAFNSKGRPNLQSKAVVVYTNGTPRKSAVIIRAFVNPKK